MITYDNNDDYRYIVMITYDDNSWISYMITCG